MSEATIVPFKKQGLTPEEVLRSVQENIDDIESVVIIVLEKSGGTKIGLSSMTNKEMVWASKMLELDVAEVLSEDG